MKNRILLAVVLCVMAAPEMASAARRNFDSSWYVGLGAYASMSEDSTISGATGSSSSDSGDWVINSASVYLGYRPQLLFSSFGAFRFELEGNVRMFDTGNQNDSGISVASFDEGLRVASLMANVNYDIHLSRNITPFIGVGAGYSTGMIQDDPQHGILESNSDDRSLAYQMMAGIALTPDGLPHTEWVIGYNRFVITDGLKFDGASGLVTVDDLQADSVSATLRYFF